MDKLSIFSPSLLQLWNPDELQNNFHKGCSPLFYKKGKRRTIAKFNQSLLHDRDHIYVILAKKPCRRQPTVLLNAAWKNDDPEWHESPYIPSNKLWRLFTDSSASLKNHLVLLSFGRPRPSFGRPRPPLETLPKSLLDVLISFATSCTNSNDSDNLERRFTSAITSFRWKSSCKPQKK